MPTLHRLRDVDPVAIALCKQGANGQRIFLRKSTATDDLIAVADRMPLHKSKDGGWSTLYCVVAQPDAKENGGLLDPDVVDVWDSPDEIRKAAHRLLKNRGHVNVEHAADQVDAAIVESAVALAPIPLEDITVPEGAWYIGIEPSTELRKSVEAGEITGVSLEGTGVRIASDEEADTATLWKTLGERLGVGRLRKHSGSLNNDLSQEEDDVADTKTENLEAKVEEIAKAQSATTTAIEGLVDTVNKLMDHFGSAEKRKAKAEDEKHKDSTDEQGEPNASDIKKAIDDLAQTVGTKLDELEEQVDKLAEGSSSQTDDTDQIKKSKSDDPLVGIL